MAKLGIALCITDLEVGGAERCLVELATRLDRGRFDPVVYCLGPRPGWETWCTSTLENAGIEVHCLGARRRRDILAVLRRLARLLRQQRPVVIQSFLFHANLLGRLAGRRAGVRWVLCGIRVAERGSRWHLWADRFTGRLVDRYVCVSQAVAGFSQTRAGLAPEKLVVIPNGIDLERYPAKRPAELRFCGIAPGRCVISFIGRLEPQKDVPWLLSTAVDWLGRLPECELLIVGKGPQRGELERLAEKLGISERVHFAGWRSDVAEILRASRLLVLSSAWEGMPNVVLEAMASGLPVVASDTEGVRELLGPAAEEQTVPYGNSEKFAGRVVEVMSDSRTANQLGARNRRRAESDFSLQRMVAAYEELWESLAQGPEQA